MRRHGRSTDTIDFSSLTGVEHVEPLENKLQENCCISAMPVFVFQVKCLSGMLRVLSLGGCTLFSLASLPWASSRCLLQLRKEPSGQPRWLGLVHHLSNNCMCRLNRVAGSEDNPCACSFPISQLI